MPKIFRIRGAIDYILYLLRDEFITPQAAPLTTPRTAEPGPGTLTITDTLNTLTINNGAIVPTAQTTAALDPNIRNAAGYTRIAGCAFLNNTLVNSSFGSDTSVIMGWSTVAAPSGVAQCYYIMFLNLLFGTGDLNGNTPTLPSVPAGASNTFFKFSHVLRGTGMFHFINQVLDWITVSGSEATLYPVIGAAAAARYNMGVDYFRVRDLGGAFATDNGIATLNVASPVTVTNYTGDADGIIDMTFQSTGTLSQAEIRYRYISDTDYWRAYFSSSGDFLVESRVANTPTNRVNVVGVISAGQTRTIRIICDGTKHNFYTLNGTTWTKQGAEINVATPMDAITTIRPIIGANWTVTNLMSFPRRSANYDQLSII